MIVRTIRETELKRVQEFCALAFEYGMKDSQRTPQEVYEQTVANPRTRQDLNWQSQWAAFEDDDRTMMSTFTVIPYRARFDGHDMLMMGVGGVSTLPQYRRRGGIRACFESALPDMYAQGAAFSYLYPFSTAYYRKFGYELGCERNVYRLLLSGMPNVSVNGQCALLEPGADMKAEIRRVYEVWQNRYNLMTIDGDIEYRWIDEANPFRDQEYTYLYRSADQSPKGYVSFKLLVEGNERNLLCTRFCFVDLEGFWGLVGLLVSTAADHKYAMLHLPVDVQLGPLLPEWSFGTVQCTREQCGMARVVDVERVLRMARMRGTGSITLEISDPQISRNNGCFEAVFESGVTTEVQPTGKTPEMRMSIQDFSSLIIGRYDTEALSSFQNVTVDCTLEKAAQVFYRKPLYINRYF